MMVVLRCGLGLLFMVSGFEKLMQPYQNFLLAVESYAIFPVGLAVWVSKAVPWFELIGGAFLFLGLHLNKALMALWFFNAALLVTVMQALLRGLDVQECGCFGGLISLTLKQVLVLDCVLFSLFYMLWISPRKARWSLDRLLEKA